MYEKGDARQGVPFFYISLKGDNIMKEVQVGLGERSYPIMIDNGLLAGIGPDLKARGIAKRFVVVTDSTVAGLYGEAVLASLRQAGLAPEIISFPAGEASKTLATVASLASRLAQLGLDRKDGLLALGGGVTGDLAGFAAAIFMRGLPFVQAPTTLLAQVDSSIGGKTGVNHARGKNLIGAFHQPRLVMCGLDTLTTLPARERRAAKAASATI